MKTKDYPMSVQRQIELIEETWGNNIFGYSRLKEIKASKDLVELFCIKCQKWLLPKRWSSLIGKKPTGCRRCENIKKGLSHRKSEEDAKAAIEKHFPGIFNLETYSREGSIISIDCIKHGPCKLPVYSFLSGHNGCVRCTGGARRVKTTEEFNRESEDLFGDQFDRSKVIYINNKEEVYLKCNFDNTWFSKRPIDHLTSPVGGCPNCDRYNKSLTTESFINRSREKFANQFKYDKTEYKGFHKNLTVTCVDHGDVDCTPANHLYSITGCKFCGIELRAVSKSYSLEEWITIFKNIHGNKYIYSNITLDGDLVKDIKCIKHGFFDQLKSDHSDGHGCPSCGIVKSGGEREVYEFIKAFYPDTEANNRSILAGKELDIYIPSINFAIEYDGLYAHSEACGKDSRYHLDKTLNCLKKGVTLIHIFEDEWLERKEIVKATLLNKLGKSCVDKYSARDLSVLPTSNEDASIFLDKYHIQGHTINHSINLGLYKDKTLVSLMCFMIYENEVVLNRYCSSGIVRGGFSKLLKHFRAENSLPIVSFSDNRWSTGNVYLANGFILESESAPSYFWCLNQKRYHRRNFQLQYLKSKLGTKFNPEFTEDQNCRNAGYFKIWDCGKKKWRYK